MKVAVTPAERPPGALIPWRAAAPFMPDPPNVLLIVADQHRGDWLGSNESVPVRTPNLNALADRGVRFTNAVTPSPLCAPARACLAGGVEYPRSPVRNNADDFPTDRPTLYRRLRDGAGYHTVTCGKVDLHKSTYEWGADGASRLDGWGFSDGIDAAGQVDAALQYVMDRHPQHPDGSWDWDFDAVLDRVRAGAQPTDPYAAYLDERGLLEPFVRKYSDHGGDRAYVSPLPGYAFQDEWIGRRAMDLLVDAPADRPWFAQINFGGPHPPFDVTPEMAGWYRDPDVEFPPPDAPGDGTTPAEHREVRRNYAAKIELIDRWIGQYVARIADRGELDDTIVIYTSDHGEMLGDRGRWGKGHADHPSIGIPMIAAGPGIDDAAPCDAPVSLLDLHRTVCDYAGVSTDAEGASLRPLLNATASGPVTTRDAVCSGLDDWTLAFDGRFKLIDRESDGDRERTLREVTDGGEHERPIDDHPAVVDRLGDRLDAYRAGP
jgi:choline-sulfatase